MFYDSWVGWWRFGAWCSWRTGVFFFSAAKNINEINGIGGTFGAYLGVPGDMLSAELNASFLKKEGPGSITDFRLGGSGSGIPGTGSGVGIGLFLEFSYTHISNKLRFNLKELLNSNKKTKKQKVIIDQLETSLHLSNAKVVYLLRQIENIIERINKKEKTKKNKKQNN